MALIEGMFALDSEDSEPVSDDGVDIMDSLTSSAGDIFIFLGMESTEGRLVVPAILRMSLGRE